MQESLPDWGKRQEAITEKQFWTTRIGYSGVPESMDLFQKWKKKIGEAGE